MSGPRESHSLSCGKKTFLPHFEFFSIPFSLTSSSSSSSSSQVKGRLVTQVIYDHVSDGRCDFVNICLNNASFFIPLFFLCPGFIPNFIFILIPLIL